MRRPRRDSARRPRPTPPPGSHLGPPRPFVGVDPRVDVQAGDPDSFLGLYRTALRLRREHLGFRGAGMAWLPAPESVLRFDRPGGLETVVNLGSNSIELPAGRPILLASERLPEVASLPPDTAVWLG